MSKPVNLEINQKVAERLLQKGLVASKVIEHALHRCAQEDSDLGQFLVKNQHLQMSQLVRLLQEIATSGGIGPKETLAASGESPGAVGLRVGSQFGDYTILSEIARGGMGIVYRAAPTGVNRVVALKILLGGAAADKTQLRRFYREAEATAKLKHPNIIPIYAVGKEAGFHYFTMEYIEGATFQEVIEDASMPLATKLEMLEKIARALQHAHEHGIVHRDIKPSNILVNRAGEPVLMDFGLAKFVDRHSAMTQTGAALGTPFYMAPEQVMGDKKKIGPTSDIYSLGVILYQTMAGQLPFQADSLGELYFKILKEEPSPLTQYQPEIPAALSAICQKSMEKEISGRYANAAELAEDLQAYRAGSKVEARRLSLKNRLYRFHRLHRQPLLWLTAVGMPLVALLLLVFYGWSHFSHERRARLENARLDEQQIWAEARALFQQQHYAETASTLEKALPRCASSARLHLLLARAYLKLERDEEAGRLLEQASTLAPMQPQVLQARADFLHAHGQSEAAAVLLEQCLKIDPTFAEAHRSRAVILFKLGQTGQAQQAIAAAKKLEEDKLQVRLQHAQQLLDQGDVARALAVVDEILAEHPNCEAVYHLRVMIYQKQSDAERALADLSRLVELNPSAENLLMRAEALGRAGLWPEAREDLRRGNQDFPQQSVFREKLAEALVALGQAEEAQQHYQALLQQSPENGLWRARLAQVAFQRQRWAEAIAHVERVLSSAPENFPPISAEARSLALTYRGLLHHQQKEWEAAIADLSAVIADLSARKVASSPSAQIFLALGESYLQTNQAALAIPPLQKAAEAFASRPEVHYLLGLSYLQTKQPQQAERCFSQCLELAPWEVSYCQARSNAWAQQGEYRQATEDLFRMRELQPENFDPFLLLLRLFVEQFSIGRFLELQLFLKHFLFVAPNVLDTDLFQAEKEELTRQYIHRYLQERNAQTAERPSSSSQPALLIRALLHSDSPTVQQMAAAALQSQYRDPNVLREITQALKTLEAGSRQARRLREAASSISEASGREQKMLLRQLLARYYTTQDWRALDALALLEGPKIQWLGELLGNPAEPGPLRFMAACALAELRQRQAHDLLLRESQGGQEEHNIMAWLALQKYNYPTLKRDLSAMARHPEPFLRSLCAGYAPLETQRSLIEHLREDPDNRVRLYAAQRLALLGDARAWEILAQEITSVNPLIRRYALAHFADFEGLAKYQNPGEVKRRRAWMLKEYLDDFLQAAEDADPCVRRIALLPIAEVGGKQGLPSLLRHLSDPDRHVQIQAVLGLAKLGEYALLMPLIKDTRQPLILRMGAFVGIAETEAIPPIELLAMVNSLLEDPEIALRTVILYNLGRMGKGIGAKLLESYLNKPDPYTRMAALGGLSYHGQPSLLPRLVNYFNDPALSMRQSAAGTSIFIAVRRAPERLPALHRLIAQGSPELREGGAFGYYNLVWDRLRIGNANQPLARMQWVHIYCCFIERLEENLQEKPDLVEELLPHLDRAIELYPTARYYFERGIFQAYRGNRGQAIRDIREAIALEPPLPIGYFWLARVLHEERDYTAALEAVQKALTLYPWYTEATILQGNILWSSGRWQEAAEVFDRLSLIDPPFFPWTSRAADGLAAVLQEAPNNTYAALHLARLEAGRGSREIALRRLQSLRPADSLTRSELLLYPEFAFLQDEPWFQTLR